MDQKNQEYTTGKGRNRLYVGLVVVVFLSVSWFIFSSNERFSRDMSLYSAVPSLPNEKIGGPIRLTIDFGEGKRRAFEGSAPTPITAADVLRYSGNTGGFSSSFMLAGEIIEIGGIPSADGKSWQWYLNGER